MDNKKMVIVTLGGGYYEERRASVRFSLSPRLPKGGLRHRSIRPRLIDIVGGDSYGC